MKKLILVASLATLFISFDLLFNFSTSPSKNTSINPDTINPPSEETGYLPEKVINNPETAEMILYEYADFACPHCADWNNIVNNLLEEYGEKIALVFRNYDLKFKNGPAAARAATAASTQGYFKEYKDLLFSNQSEWTSETEEKLNELFIDYFKVASNNAGDLEKFKTDLESDAIKARLEFEQSLGKKIHLSGTPTFRINGKTINPENLLETIKQKLN